MIEQSVTLAISTPPSPPASVVETPELPEVVVIRNHPVPPHPLANIISSRDGMTAGFLQHRALIEKADVRQETIDYLRGVLIQHHVSPEAMERLGFGPVQANLRRFPLNQLTRKGNLAEIVLAEYLAASSGVSIPVYRLRYNPNVEQSMKGDDVLAFDLDSNPIRVVVGEAKFRGTSSSAAIKDITEGLLRSYKAGLPASLQFVADRLYESGQTSLANKIQNCALHFALGKLQIDYVGMLLSDTHTAERVSKDTCNSIRRLAIISLGIEDPDSLIAPCYDNLE